MFFAVVRQFIMVNGTEGQNGGFSKFENDRKGDKNKNKNHIDLQKISNGCKKHSLARSGADCAEISKKVIRVTAVSSAVHE